MDERTKRIMDLEKALIEKSTEALALVEFENEDGYEETDAWLIAREIIPMTIQLLQVTTSPNFVTPNSLHEQLKDLAGLLGGNQDG